MTEERTQIKKKAIALLANREHGVEELRAKLLLKFLDELLVNDVLVELVQDNFLSDARYVEMMFRYHYGRGQGPRKIFHLLRQAKVSEALVQQAYREFEGDWFASASTARKKRFGDWQGDYKDKQKQMRFLSSRGFEHEHIDAAFQDDHLRL